MEPATRALVNSAGIALLTTAIGFVTTWFWYQKNAATKARDAIALKSAETEKRVSELEAQLKLVTQAVVPISTAFQAILIKELTHFHTPVMDALLVKLGPPRTLTDEEEQELIEALKQRQADMGEEISDAERDAAVMLPMVMKRAKTEEQSVTDTTLELQVVTLPLTEETETTE